MTHTPGPCPYCDTQMVNCGAPLWEDYCPNDACTGHRDEFFRSIAENQKALQRRERVREAAPEMLAALLDARVDIDSDACPETYARINAALAKAGA